MIQRTYRSAFRLALLIAIGLPLAASSVVLAEPNNATTIATASAKTDSTPLSQRFADANGKEVPDFQKHVVPLLGRLGCNGRACHGSFQGRGGFQLSLFGYDFKGDFEALHEEHTGRVDTSDIDESLILAKPLDADMHEGGKRFDQGSWQHHVLRRWIESGGDFEQEMQSLVKLEVTPAEIQFKSDNENVQLKAVAHWEDGTVEDVTELCRFSSNDDAIAAIDDTGHIQSGSTGDTHVVVYYDNAVVPVPILRPVGSLESLKPQKFDHPVDQLVQQKLDKLGIVASGTCTDAEFIRRASLDITGILPSGERVRDFLADESPNKREKLIDELLNSPGYSAWWATRFSDWTGNSDEQLNNVLPVRGAATRMWHEWLRKRLDDNMPYDDIIEGIVTAKSRQPDEDYLEYCKSMTEACKPGSESIFAERDGLPFYWARRNFAQPEERAIGFAYAFLGVRIECAQCHKHPFDQWSKDDFEQFAQLFTPIRMNQNLVEADARDARDQLIKELTGDKKLRGGDLRRKLQTAARDGKVVPFGELTVTVRGVSAAQKRAIAAAKKKGRKPPKFKVPQGKILGADKPIELNRDPRSDLMAWLRSAENPYFAKAIVNRVWSNYFGAGIVDPTDDMNLANPPSNAPLMDHLATEFIKNDFDLKWLHRTIVTSETYQRSADTNETNAHDRVNYSHHVPRRLPAEVVYDAIALATGSDDVAEKMRGEVDEMAIAEGKPRVRNRQEFALEVFGQSIRETNCDCDRTSDPSLLQSIYLRNDSEMHDRLTDKNGWVAQACKELGVPGPRPTKADPQRVAMQRRAEGYRKQIVNRIRQFHKLPEQRKEKARLGLKKEYKRATQKFAEFGFAIPDFDTLIDDIGSWKTVEPAQAAEGTTDSKTVHALVEEAYLRTLSRYPDNKETEISVAFIEESESPAEGVQSLLWALVNTKEFIITH